MDRGDEPPDPRLDLWRQSAQINDATSMATFLEYLSELASVPHEWWENHDLGAYLGALARLIHTAVSKNYIGDFESTVTRCAADLFLNGMVADDEDYGNQVPDLTSRALGLTSFSDLTVFLEMLVSLYDSRPGLRRQLDISSYFIRIGRHLRTSIVVRRYEDMGHDEWEYVASLLIRAINYE
jgi:hypothetical protein